jgi:predicted Zn finger-like uncharacterized protein
MSIIIECPSCQKQLRVPAELIGRQVRCPLCGSVMMAEEAQSSQAGSSIAPVPEPPRDYPSDREERYEVEPRRFPRPDLRTREYARQRINGPATAMLVFGILGLLGGGGAIAGGILMTVLGLQAMNNPGPAAPQAPGGPFARGVARPMPPRPAPIKDHQDDEEMAFVGPFYIVYGVFALIAALIILIGSQKMKRLESYGLAMTAAVLMVLPCFSPCGVISIGFGIWVLVALGNAEVRAAFR